MRSSEIRSRLRAGDHASHDTRHIHELARALARERLHLSAKPPRPVSSGDFLWDRSGESHKVVSRTLQHAAQSTTLSIDIRSEPDHVVGVFLERGSYQLLEMIRIAWPTVLWIGTVRDNRIDLAWSPSSPAAAVAERL